MLISATRLILAQIVGRLRLDKTHNLEAPVRLRNTSICMLPITRQFRFPLERLSLERSTLRKTSQTGAGSLPRWQMDVAQSITKGKGSSVGMPKHRGLVPKHGSTPNVGAVEGRALVPQKPMQPRSLAIVA